MKKISVVMVVLAIAVMTAMGPVVAGEKRAFSSPQEVEIRKIIHGYYLRGIEITVKDDDWGNTRIICRSNQPDDYMLFTVSSFGKVKLDEIYPASVFKNALKMEEKIQEVLNWPASHPKQLGRNHLK
ncbi:MAG: hypothetical protein A3J76_04355 [Candidatus Moranbacteria bacterium RBG_13_45_13]|nr:MAG: hypothetical protein A3J76_04355 [Candidatus Moranbacteria bacterium RBG_13_45_13]